MSRWLELNYRVSKRTLEEGGNIQIVTPTEEDGREYISELIARYPELIPKIGRVSILTPGDYPEED